MARRLIATMLRYVGLLVVLGAVGAAVFLLLGNRERIAYVEPPVAVTVQSPSTGDLQRSISLSGTVEAQALIPVIPFVSGTIQEYRVREGDVVAQGDVIATIDEQPYRQQVIQAQAAYLVAQSTFERVERLYESKATTLQNREQALAQRDGAKAQLELAQMQLGWATVTAPVAGTVLQVPSSVGNVAASNQPIAIMADLDALVVKLDIPERYFDVIYQGRAQLKANVTRIGQYGSPVEHSAVAVVESLGSYIQPQSKTFRATCRLSEGHQAFRPGMHVNVTLVYEERGQVPLLPQSVRTIDGNAYVYDTLAGTARWVRLDVLAENDLWFQVPAELADEQFIVDGQHRLVDGQRVSVVNGTGP